MSSTPTCSVFAQCFSERRRASARPPPTRSCSASSRWAATGLRRLAITRCAGGSRARRCGRRRATAIRAARNRRAQRNRTLGGQVALLASEDEQRVKDGSARSASRCCAPHGPTGWREPAPLVRDAVVAAYRALYANRERRQMGDAQGATAVAAIGPQPRRSSSPPLELFVRDGTLRRRQRRARARAGPVSSIVIDEKGERLARSAATARFGWRDLATMGSSSAVSPRPDGRRPAAYFLQSDGIPRRAHLIETFWRLFDGRHLRELRQPAIRRFRRQARHFWSMAAAASSALIDGRRSPLARTTSECRHRGDRPGRPTSRSLRTPDGKVDIPSRCKRIPLGQMWWDAETDGAANGSSARSRRARHVRSPPKISQMARRAGLIGTTFSTCGRMSACTAC